MGNQRRNMSASDWLNSAAILAGGVYLGLAIEKLLQLDRAAFWVVGIGASLLYGGVLLLDWIIDGVFNRIFPNGINPSKKPQTAERRPFGLLLSLPTGIIIGIVGAQFGLSEMLL